MMNPAGLLETYSYNQDYTFFFKGVGIKDSLNCQAILKAVKQLL